MVKTVKARKGELTIASVIFMLMVIFIHASAEGVNGYRTESVHFVLLQSAHRLSSFVVQGFIFLSGVKLFLPTGKPFSLISFYRSRLRRVVLPYLLAYCIFYIYTAAAGYIAPSVPHFMREFFTGGLIGHFYFVAIICQFYLLMPLWRWLAEKNVVLVSVVSLLLMIVMKTAVPEVLTRCGIEFSLNARMFWSYLFYFTSGIFVGRNYDTWKKMLRQNRMGIILLFVFCGIIDCVNIIVIRRALYYPSWAENFHILYCIAAVMVVMLLSERLACLSEKKLFRLADRASYNVYLIHPLFIYMTDSCFFRIGMTSLTGRFMIRLLAAVILSVAGCILWEWMKERFVDMMKTKKRKKG